VTTVWAKAGLMLRDALDSGARHASLLIAAPSGLHAQWRPEAHAGSGDVTKGPIPAAPDEPLLLRLTRRGNTITTEYSSDHGKSFHPASDPMTFDRPLPLTLHVGLVITSHDLDRSSEAIFDRFRIQPR
jgi:hypothetical protein